MHEEKIELRPGRRKLVAASRTMPSDDLSRYQHSHDFARNRAVAERNTRRVIALTAVMMAVEIFFGWRLHSMALLADGWHMGTHVAAFLLTAVAYVLARRHQHNRDFTFGTGKIDVLGGFASAIILGLVALYMGVESVGRFFSPLSIHFSESLGIAVVGLGVNLLSALLLKDGHGGHAHAGPGHGHGHHHEDLNLKAAYIHVLADAFTSILAIAALAGGKYLGWVWLDPFMGLVGGAVVAQWSWSLLRQTGLILLDHESDAELRREIFEAVESDGDAKITDLHLWQIGLGQFSAIVAIAARAPLTPEDYRQRLRQHEELAHVTIEINRRD